QRSGGTWLGVNQHGVFVGICNRRVFEPLGSNRSRGLLVKEVLKAPTSRLALERALEESRKHRFEAFNLVIADRDFGFAIHHDQEDEVIDLQPGLSIIGGRNLNDPRDERVQLAGRLLTLQNLDSPVKFLAVASKVFARTPNPLARASMVIQGGDYGTVSSTLIALGPKPRDAIFQYSDGPANEARFEDYSPLLRDILSRGLRESRSKAAAAVESADADADLAEAAEVD
ncbi:MAG: NRDE family protein, partial [Planctomycetota bacterium]